MRVGAQYQAVVPDYDPGKTSVGGGGSLEAAGSLEHNQDRLC